MRLDKYLKVSRLIKRRPLAKQIADAGRILVNDKVAKAASDVHAGDVLTVLYGNKTVIVKILEISDIANKQSAHQMFEVISEERKDNTTEDNV